MLYTICPRNKAGAYSQKFMIDSDFELDVIGLCCDFAESDYQTIATDYSIELDPEMDEDYQKQQVIEHLEGEGAYVGDSINGIVYRQF